MTAEQLVQWVTNAAFLGLSGLVLWQAARRPSRLAVDTALLFGALGVVILQGLVVRLLRIETLPVLQDLTIAIVVAIPYLTLRLAQDFARVSRLALRTSLAAAVGMTLVLLAVPTTPTWLALPLAADFIGFETYAGWVFWSAARRSAGATRNRLLSAALGSLFLGLAILAAVLRTAVPVLGPIGTQLFALASAVAYLVAFAPPSFLRRAWREPHLRAFLASVARASARPDTRTGVAALERGIATALAADSVRIFTTSDPAAAVADASEDARALVEHVLGSRRGALRERGTSSLFVVPIFGESGLLGTVVARSERAHAFADESLALLEVLAEQAAIVLESARLRDEARAASRAKSEFLANMSHELRTPLNAILGFSSLMREHAALAPEKRDRYLTNITDAGEHLLALINDVLDLSTVEAGRIQLRPDRTTVEALLQPVLASVRASAELAGVSFAADVRGDAVLRVDSQRLRQVLLNLLSNAVKFTPSGGSVTLRAVTQGADLSFEVADSGIGIPADRHSRIFGVFERVNEDRSQVGGTGLGLALTKRLIELHGGSLTFESALEAGTTFRARLPGVVVEAMRGDRVLVVEDEERDAQLIRALAGELGLQCEIVTTVAGALEAIGRDVPLGVVLDLRLPDGRGEQVLAAIRGGASTRSLPVGVVTVEDDAPAARSLGASLMLTKPIDVPALSAWLTGLRHPSPARVAS